jgi:tight adherence protein C
MDFTVILPWAIFGGLTCGLWALFTMFSSKDSRAAERLDEIRNPLLREKMRNKKQGMGAMIEAAAPALSRALEPKTELEQNALRIRLANAGFNNPEAPQLYLAIKFSMLIVGALVGGGVGMLMYGPTQSGFTTIALSAGAGFYLPELILKLVISSRKQKIFLSLPDALDLLVVCVEAGLGLDAALRRGGQVKRGAPPRLTRQ